MNISEYFQKRTWLYPVILLCVYGFFLNMKPAEPFYTPFMIGHHKNFTIEQVMNVLSPIWTYSLLALQLPVFLFTDMFRYKPTLIIQGLCLVIVYLLLCFAHSLAAMKYLQFTSALVTAAEVAYYSYMYSMVTVDQYQKITSYCRAISLFGYTTGAMLGQILASVGHVSYFYINAITLGCAMIAFTTAFFLPMPSKDLFVYKDYSKDLAERGKTNWLCAMTHLLCKLFNQLWSDFKECYSSSMLKYWSLWWALVTCGYYQVFNYAQILWNNVEPSQNFIVLNGGVEAVAALIGSVASFILGFLRLDWDVWGELALSLFSLFSSAALFIMDFTRNIWFCYTGYIVFKASYMLLITIIMLQIAVHLKKARYALVFGINNFVALLIQTALTAVIVDTRGLNLNIKSQFLVYGGYFAMISAMFLIRGIYSVCTRIQKQKVPLLTKENKDVLPVLKEEQMDDKINMDTPNVPPLTKEKKEDVLPVLQEEQMDDKINMDTPNVPPLTKEKKEDVLPVLQEEQMDDKINMDTPNMPPLTKEKKKTSITGVTRRPDG
ncbi:thiamine transporter 2-like [Discoglossus pictus]